MPISHSFTSTKSDGGDSTLVRPSNWNATHSITSTYLGYNTIGGTEESATLSRWIAKKITTTDACLAVSFDLYFRETVDSVQVIYAAIFEDTAGAIGKFIATSRSAILAPTNNATFGGGTASIARWESIPIVLPLAASTSYWFGFTFGTDLGGSPTPRVFYDGSGSDRRWDAGNTFVTDGGRYTETDTTRKYSMRLLTI